MAEWIYTGITGLQECESAPGYKKFRIQPLLGQELDYASFTYESMYGKIVSGWERNGKQIKYKISVPANTTAEIFLSGKVVETDSVCFTEEGIRSRAVVGSGEYVFVTEM